MEKFNTKFLVKAGIIGAIYVVMTMLISPIAFGENQVRVSEALNVLVYFTPAAIPGLFVGCIIANLASPFGIIDIALGSLATLLAGLVASKINNKFLVGLPSVLFNALIVGYVLNIMTSVPFFAAALSVGIGQFISVYVLGMPLMFVIEKNLKIKELLQ